MTAGSTDNVGTAWRRQRCWPVPQVPQPFLPPLDHRWFCEVLECWHFARD